MLALREWGGQENIILRVDPQFVASWDRGCKVKYECVRN